jgi:hypothetical protein
MHFMTNSRIIARESQGKGSICLLVKCMQVSKVVVAFPRDLTDSRKYRLGFKPFSLWNFIYSRWARIRWDTLPRYDISPLIQNTATHTRSCMDPAKRTASEIHIYRKSDGGSTIRTFQRVRIRSISQSFHCRDLEFGAFAKPASRYRRRLDAGDI